VAHNQSRQNTSRRSDVANGDGVRTALAEQSQRLVTNPRPCRTIVEQ
jgi:hypothetical protein